MNIVCLPKLLISSAFQNQQTGSSYIAPSQKPLVIDFTANILGPAEGFHTDFFTVYAGIGDEQARMLSWKVSVWISQQLTMLRALVPLSKCHNL